MDSFGKSTILHILFLTNALIFMTLGLAQLAQFLARERAPAYFSLDDIDKECEKGE